MKPLTQESKADPKNLAYVGSKPGDDRDSDSWYTPEKYIEEARDVLRRFDFDPFSSEEANTSVRAVNYYDEAIDAFTTDWPEVDTVWMNPPYGRGLITSSIARFMKFWQCGRFKSGIVLVNNATETKWFQKMLEECTAVCLTDHRIAFISPDGKAVSGNTRGQAFFLFSSDRGMYQRFKKKFQQFGTIVRPV